MLDIHEVATGIEFVCRVIEFVFTERNDSVTHMDSVAILVSHFVELSPSFVGRVVVRDRSTEGICIEGVAVEELKLTLSVGSVGYVDIDRTEFSKVRALELDLGDDTANEHFVILLEASSDSLSYFVLMNDRSFFLNNVEETFVPALYVTSGVEGDLVVTSLGDNIVVVHSFGEPSNGRTIVTDYFELVVRSESELALVLTVVARGELVSLIRAPDAHRTSYIVVDFRLNRDIRLGDHVGTTCSEFRSSTIFGERTGNGYLVTNLRSVSFACASSTISLEYLTTVSSVSHPERDVMVLIAISGLDTGYITLNGINSTVVVKLVVCRNRERSGSSLSAVGRISKRLFLNSLSSYSLGSRIEGNGDGILAILSNIQHIVLCRISDVPAVVLNHLELDRTSGQVQLSLLPGVNTIS